MIRNPFVGLARVGWMEFRSHLKSPRLLVVAALLALLVFGASYGLSQTPSNPFTSGAQVFGHPAIVNESGVDHYLAIGFVADLTGVPRAGVNVSLYLQTKNTPPGGTGTLVGSQDTNASGFVAFDLGTAMPMNTSYEFVGPANGIGPSGIGFFGLANETFTFVAGQYGYSTPSGSVSAFYVHVLAIDGRPATIADVYANQTLLGHPDANGFFTAGLPPGNTTVRIVYQGYEQDAMFYGSPSSGPAYASGADSVLLAIAGFLSLILPIVAIAVSFDAISRERVQGSLELLLCRRIRREGILAGKFLGEFAAIAVPVLIVLAVGAEIVTIASGRAPSASVVAAAFVGSLFLVAAYVLLMLLFSSLAKSVGTAVLFGVVVFLVFDFLFSFLVEFFLFSVGGNPTNPDYYRVLSALLLLDPNLVFQLLISLGIPSSGGGANIGLTSPYLSSSTISIAAVLWIVLPLILALVVFRRKAEG